MYDGEIWCDNNGCIAVGNCENWYRMRSSYLG